MTLLATPWGVGLLGGINSDLIFSTDFDSTSIVYNIKADVHFKQMVMRKKIIKFTKFAPSTLETLTKTFTTFIIFVFSSGLFVFSSFDISIWNRNKCKRCYYIYQIYLNMYIRLFYQDDLLY